MAKSTHPIWQLATAVRYDPKMLITLAPTVQHSIFMFFSET